LEKWIPTLYFNLITRSTRLIIKKIREGIAFGMKKLNFKSSTQVEVS